VRALLGTPRPASVRALVSHTVAVRYVGFPCFGETDEPSASDEPFFVFGVVPSVVAEKNTTRTRIYEEIDSGESVTDLIPLYQGAPLGGVISVTLCEHDVGDPDKFKDNVERAVDRVSDKVLEGLTHIPTVGPALNVLGEIAMIVAGPAFVDFLNEALGTDDDFIGTVSVVLTPQQMLQLSRSPRRDFEDIEAHIETPLISGDGASYKAYFDVVTV
jgi:hypothetical protein